MLTMVSSVFSFACLPLLFSGCYGENIKIAAFNIQIFGKTKMSKTEVVGVLVDIVSKYDIILIQEIRDSSGESIVQLVDLVNAKNRGSEFSMKLSPRLGRTSSKEQYAYLYREKIGLSVVNDYVYDDGNETTGTDTFEREPYIVLFQTPGTKLRQFAVIGIHVAPGDAVEEIQAFGDVFADVRSKTNTDDIVLMGDLNADCSYVPASKWDEIPLRNNSNYIWLIPDDADTTVSNSVCSYDRFIMTGEALKEAYVNGSAKVVRFDTEYGLNQTFALQVSDHYPISFELYLGKQVYSSSGFSTGNIVLCACHLVAFYGLWLF